VNLLPLHREFQLNQLALEIVRSIISRIDSQDIQEIEKVCLTEIVSVRLSEFVKSTGVPIEVVVIDNPIGSDNKGG
jgi:hypothetical protein